MRAGWLLVGLVVAAVGCGGGNGGGDAVDSSKPSTTRGSSEPDQRERSTSTFTTGSTTTSTAPATTTTAARVQPVTLAELDSFDLPAEVCGGLGLPSGSHRLTNGEYHAADDLRIVTQSPAVGDVDGDGVDDGAFTVLCGNGIADHFTDVYAVLAVDRSLQPVPAYESSGDALADVDAVTVGGGTITVGMRWAIDEPFCCATTFAAGTYAWNGAAFVEQGLRVVDDPARTRQLIDALNAGDQGRVADLVADGWEGYFDTTDLGVDTWTFGGCNRLEFGGDDECRLLYGPVAFYVRWTSEDGSLYDLEHLVAQPIEYGD